MAVLENTPGMAADSPPPAPRRAGCGPRPAASGVAVYGSAAESFGAEQTRRYFRLKRCPDLALSCLFLVLLAPIMALIAVVIKLDSEGPALFRQERMGYDWRNRRARPFVFYKFRSMYNNCDQSVHQRHVQQWARAQRVEDPASSPTGKEVPFGSEGRPEVHRPSRLELCRRRSRALRGGWRLIADYPPGSQSTGRASPQARNRR